MSSNDPRKRIAIVGSGGRLGGLLATTLEKDHNVIRLARAQLDIGDPRSIAAALEPLEYDQLVIAGALTAVDHCESHATEAFSINAEGPGEIAAISAAKGAHVTYFSTDLVYEGAAAGLYSETDATNPISVYGASKLRGEERVLAVSPANLVLRISWLYGPGKAAFPEWIIQQACAKEHVTLPGDKTGCPTFSADLVQWTRALLAETPASGIYNLCNSGICTWRDWGQFCIDTARDAGMPVLAREIEGVPVRSVPAFTAKRPLNSAMSTAKFTARTGISPRLWQDAQRDFLLQGAMVGV